MNKKIKIVAASVITASMLTSCNISDVVKELTNSEPQDDPKEIELTGVPVPSTQNEDTDGFVNVDPAE